MMANTAMNVSKKLGSIAGDALVGRATTDREALGALVEASDPVPAADKADTV